MSYELATLPALHSVEKQQNVDEWKTASMHAHTHRSMDAACTRVWTLENGSLPVGSRVRDPVDLGTKHKSSKTPRKQMQMY